MIKKTIVVVVAIFFMCIGGCLAITPFSEGEGANCTVQINYTDGEYIAELMFPGNGQTYYGYGDSVVTALDGLVADILSTDSYRQTSNSVSSFVDVRGDRPIMGTQPTEYIPPEERSRSVDVRNMP